MQGVHTRNSLGKGGPRGGGGGGAVSSSFMNGHTTV